MRFVVVDKLFEFVPPEDPSRITTGDVVWRFVEETFAERERDDVCLFDDDNGRLEAEVKREWAIKEFERGGIAGDFEIIVFVVGLVDPWNAIVAGFKTVRNDELFDIVFVVERNGVIEIFSLLRVIDELVFIVIGKVAERARIVRVEPFNVCSFGWIVFVDIMDV